MLKAPQSLKQKSSDARSRSHLPLTVITRFYNTHANGNSYNTNACCAYEHSLQLYVCVYMALSRQVSLTPEITKKYFYRAQKAIFQTNGKRAKSPPGKLVISNSHTAQTESSHLQFWRAKRKGMAQNEKGAPQSASASNYSSTRVFNFFLSHPFQSDKEKNSVASLSKMPAVTLQSIPTPKGWIDSPLSHIHFVHLFAQENIVLPGTVEVLVD